MKIGLIGCGNMGKSIAKRLTHSHELAIYDKHPPAALLKEHPNIRACQDLQELAAHAEVIFVVVKPKDLDSLASHLKPHLQARHILISVLAGTPLARLQQALGDKQQILRMMPNLAVEYGQGVLGVAESPTLKHGMKDQITNLLTPLGLVIWLPEEKIDAITSLAGSGPAFVLIMIEAMVDSGILMGFTSQEAMQITTQTIKGALQMLEQTKNHPAELRWQVSSPSGTTIAGTHAMENSHVRAGIINTFMAAYHRAQQP